MIAIAVVMLISGIVCVISGVSIALLSPQIYKRTGVFWQTWEDLGAVLACAGVMFMIGAGTIWFVVTYKA